MVFKHGNPAHIHVHVRGLGTNWKMCYLGDELGHGEVGFFARRTEQSEELVPPRQGGVLQVWGRGGEGREGETGTIGQETKNIYTRPHNYHIHVPIWNACAYMYVYSSNTSTM